MIYCKQYFDIAVSDKKHNSNSSIYYGSSGVAFLLFLNYKKKGDNLSLLEQAAYLSNNAILATSSINLSVPELKINPETIGLSSLFYGLPGIFCTNAIINYTIDKPKFESSLSKYIEETNKGTSNLDLFLGKAGLLLGLIEVYKQTNCVEENYRAQIFQRGQQLYDELFVNISENITKHFPSAKDAGIAHGYSGIFFSLMKWQQICSQNSIYHLENFKNLLFRFLEIKGLTRSQIPKFEMNSHQNWVITSFCNGLAGYIYFLIKCYEHYKTDDFLIAASQLCNRLILLYKRNNKNFSLCCGYAGQIYAMLCLYKKTQEVNLLKNSRYIYNSLDVSGVTAPIPAPFSAFAGKSIMDLLKSDIEDPMQSEFPLIES